MPTDPLPDCAHRGKLLGPRCFCRHPQIRGRTTGIPVPVSQCASCPLREAGAGAASRRHSHAERDACVHRGEVIAREPCSCGAAKRIEVHACALLKRCVLTESARMKFKDADLRAAFEGQTCERCTDYQAPPATSPELMRAAGLDESGEAAGPQTDL